jgi:hypothetical protein
MLARKRGAYKVALKEKRQDYASAQENGLIEEAKYEYVPFQTQKIRHTKFPGAIPMETWGKHFKTILNIR